MKYLTDQFSIVFFALATLNNYNIFLHCQQNWHPYRQLASCQRWRNRGAAWA